MRLNIMTEDVADRIPHKTIAMQVWCLHRSLNESRAQVCHSSAGIFFFCCCSTYYTHKYPRRSIDMRRRSLIPNHEGSRTDALTVPTPQPLRPAYQRAPASTASSKSNCDHCGNLAPKYGLTTVYGTPLNQGRAPSPLASSKEAGTYPSSYSTKVSSPNQPRIF